MAPKRETKNWLILAASADEQQALWLQALLRAGNRRADIALWRAELPGQETTELAKEVERLFARSLGVIGLLSQMSLGAGMPKAVWLTVLRDFLLGERPFLALRIEACDPGPIMGQLSFLTLQESNPQLSANAILQVIYGQEQYPSQIGSSRPDLHHLPGLAQSERAVALVHLARQLVDIDDADSAVACLMAALAVRERILSPADPLISATLLTAAEVTLAAGRPDTAREHLLAAYKRLSQSPWGSKTLLQQWTQIERLAELAESTGDTSLGASVLQLQREMLPRMKGSGFDAGLSHARAGRIARDSRDDPAAIEDFHAALNTWRQDPPEAPQEYARLLNDLGTLTHQQGDFPGASGFLIEALSRWRALRGDQSPEVATTLINLSALRRSEGNYALAREMLLEVLRIRQSLDGPLDPAIGSTLHHLASVEEAEGNSRDAEGHYRQALKILEQHDQTLSETSIIRNNLALLLERQGRLAEAGALLEESWTRVCNRLGAEDAACIPILENAAAHLERTGQLEPAMDRRQHMLTLLAKDPQRAAECARQWRLTALLAARLGKTDLACGSLQEAERYLTQLSADHPERVALRPLQTQLLSRQDDVATTAKLLEATVTEMLQRVQPNDPQLIPPLEELATLQEKRGDLADAATYLERVLHIRESQVGRSHPDLITTLLSLGRVYKARGSKGRTGSIVKRITKLLSTLPQPVPEWQEAVSKLEE